eukprot:TRINITY_DN1187_c0_g2_i1.p1 TRINITY_DN1187_c0_g2~~TRINITY_DN1187_c0_g2_i1.p1  ORF type:complete len:839 (+),score=292.08 TRINITY_DN1187_c0_g2_i1:14101-16617(+)
MPIWSGRMPRPMPPPLPRTVSSQPCCARKCTTFIKWLSEIVKTLAISAMVARRSGRAARQISTRRLQSVKLVSFMAMLQAGWSTTGGGRRGCALDALAPVTTQQAEGVARQHQRARSEDDVTRHAQPHQCFHDLGMHDLGGTRKPHAAIDAGPGLVDAGRQQRQEHHHRQADIEAPIGGPEQAIGMPLTRIETTQAEQHEPDAQHAVDPEQRRMAVCRCHVQTLHVVQRGRRIDGKAQHARTHRVPETDGDEAQDRPPVGLHPRRSLGAAIGLQGLQADHGQGHHFEGGEHRPYGDHRGRRAGEVQVMQGAQDAAEEEDDGLGHDGAVGRGRAHQPQTGEDQRHDGGRKHFEETFHPQVDQPPAPVLDHRVMGMLAPHQRAGIEAADAGGRQEHHGDQATALRGCPEGGPERASQQEQPEQQADEEQDLPDTSHAGVFQALVADPEAEVGAGVFETTVPARGGGTHHDGNQGPEQHIHTELLEARLAARQQGRDIQSRGQPGRGDPEDAHLRVDGTAHHIGQQLRQWNAEEALALDRIVGGDGPHADLQQEQADHGKEILARGLHGRRRHDIEEGIGLQRRERVLVLLAAMEPHHGGDAGNEQHDTGHRPHRGRHTHLVAHQRFVRPVAGVGKSGFTRTVGRRSPGRPEEEGPQRLAVRSFRQAAGGHGVLLAQRLQRGIAAEQRLVMRSRGADGLRPLIGDGEDLGGDIVAVVAHLIAHGGIDAHTLRGSQCGGCTGKLARAQFAQCHGLAMQPVGRPVRRNVGAMAPDAAQLLATGGQPGLLPGLDLLARIQHLALHRHHGLGNGRRRQVDLVTQKAQRTEGKNEDQAQPAPEPVI